MKEIIGITIIVILVSTASLILQKYLEKTSDEILSKLDNLKEEIKLAQETNDTTKTTEISNDIVKKWEEVSEIWSTIVVHQELDNIKLSILEVNGAVETGSFDDALEEIDKTIFLAGHIKEKESFRLKNIF